MTDAEHIEKLRAQLKEARELLEHFRYIAHGPGCICVMCERRNAFLTVTAPRSSP
jgi:hypothetical protein